MDDMKELIEKAHTKIAKAKANIVLDHAFFAAILLKRPIEVRPLQYGTMQVTNSGKISADPRFVDMLTLPEVIFVLCHEVMHYASGHGIRMQGRDPRRWNIAGDKWINDTLKRCNVGTAPAQGVFEEGAADKTVEQLYAELDDDQDNDDPMGGDLVGGDGGDGGEPSDSEADAQRKLDVSEASQIARAMGQLPGILKQFAAETVNSKVPWYSVLERYMTERIKCDYSWARPNRRYAPEFYLPSLDGQGAMGEIVLQIDVSGSISASELGHYEGHVRSIVEQCHPTKTHVIYTDTSVVHHDTYDNADDLRLTFRSGGGTRMEAGFEYLQAQGIEPEVVVTLTDAYDRYTTAPPFPTVWCVSTSQPVPYGEVVRFTTT